MFKKATSFILSLSMMGAVLVGCSAKGAGEKELSEIVTQEIDQQESRSIVVTDQLGRTVEIPRGVDRIVSSYYITSSLLIALGAEDKVVGIEMKADTREIYKKAAPEFLELPAVGSGKTFNVEEALALDPDLVIIPYRLKEFIPQLEALNIPVLAVEPESMEDFLECVELIGIAIGEEEKAEKLSSYYTDKMDEIKSLTGNVEERPAVYMSGGSSALTTATSNMYQHDLIEMAGGTNVAAGLEEGYWANVSVEELLLWNPKVIYNVGYASYGKEAFTEDAKLAGISAVQNNQIYTFPSILEPWDYPTPSSVLGILWLVNNLHPELYSIEKYTEEAQDFYQTFFDIEVTAEDMGL